MRVDAALPGLDRLELREEFFEVQLKYRVEGESRCLSIPPHQWEIVEERKGSRAALERQSVCNSRRQTGGALGRRSKPGPTVAAGREFEFRGSDFVLLLCIEEGPSGIVLDLEIEAARDLLLDEVRPFCSSWPFRSTPSETRVFLNGFQSWTPTGSTWADAAPLFPRVRAFATMNLHVDSPFWRRKDGLCSHDVMVLEEDSARGEGRALLIGYLSAKKGLGEIFLRNRKETSLTACLDYGGRLIRSGETLATEPLLIARGEAESLLDGWASELGRRMDARIPSRSPVGWCSWYEYYNRVTEIDVLANLEVLRVREGITSEIRGRRCAAAASNEVRRKCSGVRNREVILSRAL